jgi:hypothetical protein
MGAMMRVWLLLSLWLEYNPLQFLLSFYPSRSCEIVYCICASTLCAVWSCLFCYALITSLLTGCQTALWSSDFTLFSIFLLGSLSVALGVEQKLFWCGCINLALVLVKLQLVIVVIPLHCEKHLLDLIMPFWAFYLNVENKNGDNITAL